jgi:hypothetical protein
VILDAVLVSGGIVIVLGTALSAIRTVVLPRAASTLIGRLLFPSVRKVFLLAAKARKDFEAKDRILALYAPTVLLLLPFVWATLITLGFALIYMGVLGVGFGEAFEVSGSSLLTLGFTKVEGSLPLILEFSEAAIGLVIVALLITFLPSLYQAYAARETAVNALEVRAGVPPSSAEMLIRHSRIVGLDTLAETFDEWEQWFIELEESHSAFPVLAFFRGPTAQRSWLTSAGTVLDAGALLITVVKEIAGERRPQVELSIRAGFIALRRIADGFGIPYDPDPSPTDPIAVDRSEFMDLVRRLEEGGVEVVDDLEEAWRNFAGWRVNYDAPLLGLAQLIVAPEAPWVSDRPPLAG